VVQAQRTLDDLLAEARAKIIRLSATAAMAAAERGALLVDVRSDRARGRDGVVPGAVHVPRTVLEWRFEPGGAWRSPWAAELDQRLVVLCEHGYSSILAAAALVGLGYESVADVEGGFEAWRAAGLPVGRARIANADEVPGMGGPD